MSQHRLRFNLVNGVISAVFAGLFLCLSAGFVYISIDGPTEYYSASAVLVLLAFIPGLVAVVLVSRVLSLSSESAELKSIFGNVAIHSTELAAMTFAPRFGQTAGFTDWNLRLKSANGSRLRCTISRDQVSAEFQATLTSFARPLASKLAKDLSEDGELALSKHQTLYRDGISVRKKRFYFNELKELRLSNLGISLIGHDGTVLASTSRNAENLLPAYLLAQDLLNEERLR
ncbi:MAG: hypothetical protein AAFQ82_19830 [Myxococcota bacterium]